MTSCFVVGKTNPPSVKAGYGPAHTQIKSKELVYNKLSIPVSRSLCVCIVRVYINNEELFLMLSPFWIGLGVVRSTGNLSSVE